MKNQFKLFKRVIAFSSSNEWEKAIKEWEIIKVTEAQEDDFGSCICGKRPIKQMIQMHNPKTRTEIIVGNCCVNKFLGIKDYNKVFSALRKERVNQFMIEESRKKEIINAWESKFMLDVWRKRKLSSKQKEIYTKIKNKIISFYRT